jgi:hypothetical protein
LAHLGFDGVLYVERDGEEQLVLGGLADGIGRVTGKLDLVASVLLS